MTRRDDERRFGGEEARRLIRQARTATLATLLDCGTPYASLVKVASDFAGQPLILVSRLAWHTRNLEADGRGSLLFCADPGEGDPLEAARLTAIGRLSPCPDEDCARRFLACHPEAAGYAAFSDFGFWRMEMERCHAIAGFGRIETLEAGAVVLPRAEADALGQLAPEALDHVNREHQDALGLYSTQLLRQPPADWRAAALDADGIDLSDGRRSHRLAFAQPVRTAAELRAALKALAEKARQI